MYNRKLLKRNEKLPESLSYYPAIVNADLKKFKKSLENQPYIPYLVADLSKKVKNDQPGLIRDKADQTGDHLPDQDSMLEMK